MPYSQKRDECNQLARTLSQRRRPAQATPPPRRERSFGLLVLAGLALAAGAAYLRLEGELSWPGRAATIEARASEGSEPRDPEAARRERARRVCDATRARVLRGATVGPTDVEGWVVELSLIREGSQVWKSLDQFVDLSRGDDAGHISWSGAPELAAIEGYTTRVEVRSTALPGESTRFQRLDLSLHGSYVSPYFRERQRIRLVRFAHALAEFQQASLAGLYARCEGGTTHHLGSWFLGSSPGKAAASLLFFMGAYAEPAHLPRKVLTPRPDQDLAPAHALDQLIGATADLTRKDVAKMIGSQDGMVAGPETFTALQFPFVDSNRSLRASRGIARDLSFR
jgi:serine/threonine-protein kinase